jgi:hypothetical protein
VTKEAFIQRCERVAENMGVEVVFFKGDGFERQFEDDGCLHIVRASTRACFDVSNGQNGSGEAQNAKTREVMRALGMTKLIGDSVLVDERDDDADVCPHCGRSM